MNMSKNETRHILLLSGGKDSTALALYMHDNYPEIELEYLFTDTHKELDETYEYMAKIEAYLGKEITRLQSDLDDRGFDHYLKLYGDYLPSPQMRWCTKNLKLNRLSVILEMNQPFYILALEQTNIVKAISLLNQT